MAQLLAAFVLVLSPAQAPDTAHAPDIATAPKDLVVPRMSDEDPGAGKRVRQVLHGYEGTEVFHSLFLPEDWCRDSTYPVIVEYAGNGPYSNDYGDICTGNVEDCRLGYGIGGGRRFIWLCLPFVDAEHRRNERRWWGDVEATVAYCIEAVETTCRDFGGDRRAVILVGFSRGAIACNYIGLHDDAIGGLWRAFVVHSHYDGVRQWGYPGDDRAAAAARLARLRGRPQFISHERSVEATRAYLESACPDGRFTFCAIPFRNHTDAWVLCDIPERRKLREWVELEIWGYPILH